MSNPLLNFVVRMQCSSCNHCKLQNSYCNRCANFICNICTYQRASHLHSYIYRCSSCFQTYCVTHYISHIAEPLKCTLNQTITISEHTLDNLKHGLPHSPSNSIAIYSIPSIPINLRVLQWKISKISTRLT